MKAQGLSLTTIIIAAICLIVLVVLIVIFTGNINKWGTDIKSCKARGGECGGSSCGPGETEVPNTDCEQACCIKIFENP